MRKPIDLHFKKKMLGEIAPKLNGVYGMYGILDEIYDLLRSEILVSAINYQKADIENY